MSALLDVKRCKRCGWPTHERVEDGCVEDNCSQRPMPPLRDVAAPLSEAGVPIRTAEELSAAYLRSHAGDKVTVPMTEGHVKYLRDVWVFGTVPDSVEQTLLREIESNLRSQVESGMTGRFNPETHRAVPLHELLYVADKLYPSDTSDRRGQADNLRIELLPFVRLWLSPSPETAEGGK